MSDSTNFSGKTFAPSFDEKLQLSFIKIDLLLSVIVVVIGYFAVINFASQTLAERYIAIFILISKALIYFLILKEKREFAGHLIVISEFLATILTIYFVPSLGIAHLGFVLMLFTPFIVLKFNSKASYWYAFIGLSALIGFSTYFYFNNQPEVDKIKSMILFTAICIVSIYRIMLLANLVFNNIERLFNDLNILNTLYKKAPYGIIIENKQTNELAINNEIRKNIDFSNVANHKAINKLVNEPSFAYGKWNKFNFPDEGGKYTVRKDEISEDLELTWLQKSNKVDKQEKTVKIKESKEIYELVIDNVYDAIIINKYNQKTKVEEYTWNKKFSDLLELDEDEKNISVYDFFPEKQSDHINSIEKFKQFHNERRQEKFVKTKWQFLTKKKKLLFTSLTMVRNITDEFFTTVVLINDETTQYNYKTDLITKESLYNNLIMNSYAGVIIDVENKMLGENTKICNSKVYDIFKVDENKKEITSFKSYYPKFQDNGKSSEEEFKRISAILTEEGKVEYEWKIFDDKKNLIYLYVQSSKQNLDDTTTLCITYITDVTSEKSKEETIGHQINELKVKNKRLQQYFDSNQSLEGFAYKAAHDLKSPLRNVSGFAQLLERRIKHKLNSEEEEYLSFIIDSSKSMQQLIDDLLDYARVEKMDVESASIKTINLLNRIELDLNEEIGKHNFSIITKKLPQTIYGEMALIKRLFIELIKHSNRHKAENRNLEIEISCEVLESQSLFKLKDNTEGFSEKDATKIFEPFANFGNNKNSSVMSMSICKKIVMQHGGEIWAESKLGVGTTFNFSLRNGA